LKRIAFINPKMKKLPLDLWSSNAMRLLQGTSVHSSAVLSKLAPMVFAALTPSNYEFVYIDEEIEEINFEMDVDLVAITSMTAQANRGYEIADRFRKKKIPVVMGGIHASVLPDEVSQHCDAAIIGEGENIWPEMLKDFEQGALKKIYNARDYPPVTKLISPRLDVVNHDKYLVFPIQATRGCPYDCDFCSIKHAAGHRYRLKPVEQVIAEIKDYETYNKKKFGIFKKTYVFVDDNLYVNRNYIKELFTAMSELDIIWKGQGTLDTAFDEEILALMAKSGCRSYTLGLETVSEKTLEEMNKPKTNKAKNYEVAFKNLNRHGIMPLGSFIYGFDSDDEQVFQHTVDFIVKNRLLQPYFNILTPYPGTRLYDRIQKEDRIFETNWDYYNTLAPVFTPKQMSASQLKEGAVWSTKQMASIDLLKEQLTYFWSHGPWPYLRALNMKERLILRLVGLKLKKISLEYCEFLFWAARQKNACHIAAIIGALISYENKQRS